MLAFLLLKKRSLGLAVKGGSLALGAPSTWSRSTFGEASASACLDGLSSSHIVEIKIMINVYFKYCYSTVDYWMFVGVRTVEISPKNKI